VAEETALKSDSLTVKAKLSQQRLQLLTLQDQLNSQKEALNVLLGRDLRTGYSVTLQPVSALETLDLATAQEKALRQRPEMEQARLQSQRAELAIRSERAQYLPDLSAQISYVSFPNVNFIPQNLVSAGFLLQWQPFDWGLKKHKIAELRNDSAQAGLSEKNVQQQILIDVNSSYRKLMESRTLLDVQAAFQEAEREKLRVVVNSYEQKAVLLNAVLQEQDSLSQADTQYQQALANFWTAKAAFDRALGEK